MGLMAAPGNLQLGPLCVWSSSSQGFSLGRCLGDYEAELSQDAARAPEKGPVSGDTELAVKKPLGSPPHRQGRSWLL